LKIIVLIREPFLDKIPSLKTLIWHLAQAENEIVIITSKDYKYPTPSFRHPLIRIISVNKRSKFLELPTIVKLGCQFLKVYYKWNNKISIGGDAFGNLLLGSLKKVLRIKHVFFMLEYPQIVTPAHPKLTFSEKQEIKVLENANLIITHDIYHRNFLVNNFKINPINILLLPNSTFTDPLNHATTSLHKKFGLSQETNIILHCGGLGMWFKCKELARSTDNWPEGAVLVFHTSHKVEDDVYYREISSFNYNNKVLFSTLPVSTEELDNLICSAKIGIAIYSKEILGYRADLLGFAAGKVGNYLKCGLPVIASKLSSFTFVEEYKCGILIENESDIAQAIKRITKEYFEYSKNAKKCYEDLWHPAKYIEKIKIHLSTF
jgi:hypothetical protein